LHDADYGGGHLYILTIPENFADLYEIPAPVLNAIRATLTPSLPVQIEAPGKVSLFLYDNGTFIVESFRDEPVDAAVTFDLAREGIEDVLTGEVFKGEVRTIMRRRGQPPEPYKHAVAFKLAPHSYRVFRLK
jgi:hypothetical protein